MIDSYKPGEFVVNKNIYKGNLILIGDKVKLARHLIDHQLMLDDFTEMINSKPSTIIIGTGTLGKLNPKKELIDYIKRHKINVIVAITAEACRIYDNLLGKGQKVAAFMHDTC